RAPPPPLFSSLCLCPSLRTPISTLFPYTTLFRSLVDTQHRGGFSARGAGIADVGADVDEVVLDPCEQSDHLVGQALARHDGHARSEEHTSELQSRFDLVCRLLLEKKKT